MNRRSFFKTVGGLAAAIALPLESIAKVLPETWAISPIRWTKEYDLTNGYWLFRADVFIGKKVAETPETISLAHPQQLGVDIRSDTEELNEQSKEAALLVLMTSAEAALKELQA